jgi:TonB family protein
MQRAESGVRTERKHSPAPTASGIRGPFLTQTSRDGALPISAGAGKMDRPVGPSQFIRAPEVTSVERRLRLRRSPLALTYVTLGENNGGIVTNISETGIGMTTARPLRENSSSHLSFQLSELGPAIETGVEIVWMTESRKEAGFRFEGLPAEVREQIRNWVSSPARGNDSQNWKEHPRNVEDHLPSGSALRQSPFPTPAPEQESAPKAAPEPGRDDASLHATPAPPAPVQAFSSPPLFLGPALFDPGLQASSFRTGATDSVSETYRKRTSPIAALVALIVVACFALGFEASPDFLRNWLKANDARHVDGPGLSISKNPTPSANLAAKPDETSDRAAEPLAPASSTPAPAEKTYRSKPEDSERREMPRPLAERSSSRAVNSALNPATIAPAPAKTTIGTTAVSSPAEKGAMPGTESFAQQPAASNISPTEAASPSMPAPPPARAEEPATRPANPPPSFFPVIAPGAGNVPRLVELPSEMVIDSATVLIHSRQIVFVPAEPGPESSHNPEKLQIGERISKVAPAYPAQAVQKGLGGTVHLHATIGKSGTVESVRPIKGPVLLIPAALDAVRQWRYRPTLLDQQPTEMQEDLTIEFRPLG